MKELDEVFGAPGDDKEVVEIKLEDVSIVSKGTEIDINSDYSFSRYHIIKSIIRSSEVLDLAVTEVKMDAANPKNIEAAASITKNLNDATENLLKLHKEFRNIQLPKGIPLEDDEQGVAATLTDILSAIENKK